MNEIVKQTDDLLFNLVIKGDVSALTAPQKMEYYNRFCETLGLNAITRPFEFIRLQGKEVLYAKKDATEQLRKRHGVSVEDLTGRDDEGYYIVTVKVRDKEGRADISTAAIFIGGMSPNDRCNAIMKCETKAKRRATLSICGLGIMDESEIEDAVESEKPGIHITEKKQGDYKQAAAAIGKAQTLAEVEKYSKMLLTRTWTDDESELLDNLIEDKKTEIGGM